MNTRLGITLLVIGVVAAALRVADVMSTSDSESTCYGRIINSAGIIQSASAQTGQSCAAGSTTRTTICHVPPGNPQNAETGRRRA